MNGKHAKSDQHWWFRRVNGVSFWIDPTGYGITFDIPLLPTTEVRVEHISSLKNQRRNT